VFNDKMTDALPLVHKAYKMKKENKFTEQFENWANVVSEGAWALPETDDEVSQLISLLEKPLPVGVDAQNATNALYNILGDDRLFDRLEQLAETDPEADARDVVLDWLRDNLPQIYQQIENEIGDPDVPAEPGEQEIDEGAMSELHAELSDKYNELAPKIEKYKDAAGAEHLYKELAAIAKQHGASEEFARMCRGARNSAHADYDTNPGGFENWFWYLGLGDEVDEGNTYGSGDGGMDGVVYEDDDEQVCVYCGEPRDDKFSCCDENHWVPKSEFDKDEVKEDKEECKYCGGDCPNDEEHACDGYLGDIDDLYKANESKDKITYDPVTGKLTGWEHEGDWKKSTGKNPVGKIHNLSDKARRETEKMAKDTVKEDDEDLLANTEAIQSAIIRRILNSINDHSELLKKAGPDGVMNAASDVASFHAPMEEIGSSDVSIMVREVYREVGVDYPEDEHSDLHEAFDQALNEGAINNGDKVTCPDGKTGRVTGEGDGYYFIKGDDGEDYAYQKHEIKAAEEELDEATIPSSITQQLVGNEVFYKTPGSNPATITGVSPDGAIFTIQLSTGQKVGAHINELFPKFEPGLVANLLAKAKEYQPGNKLQALVGQEVYVPGSGTTGQVIGISERHRNSVVIALKNGTQTVAHIGDISATKPGFVKQLLDKLNSITGGGKTPPLKAKSQGELPYDMKNKINFEEDIKKLAGLIK
jgi:hypothetical protein